MAAATRAYIGHEFAARQARAPAMASALSKAESRTEWKQGEASRGAKQQNQNLVQERKIYRPVTYKCFGL